MIVFYGTRLYGRTDVVPDLFRVQTKFAHMWFLPVIPLGSHLVMDSSDGPIGIPVSFSIKSWLLTWARLVTFVMAMGFLGGFAESPRPETQSLVSGIAFACIWAFLMFGRLCLRASYNRAVRLVKEAGLSEEFLVLIDRNFGVITDEEANQELQSLLEEREAEERARFEGLEEQEVE